MKLDRRSWYHIIVSGLITLILFPILKYHFDLEKIHCSWITAATLLVAATGSELWDITLKPYLSKRLIFYKRYWPSHWDTMDWFYTVVPGLLLIVILNFIL